VAISRVCSRPNPNCDSANTKNQGYERGKNNSDRAYDVG
jgi:hypothetical protein